MGFVNLHPSFLPYNRGKHPYYWSIVDNTPAGVTIHFITDKIDDGGILFQRRIKTDITTTATELYSKSIEEIISLFKENYVQMLDGHFKIQKQDEEQSTFHWGKEIKSHSKIKLDQEYKALDLLNIIRARNFPGNPSSFFHLNGKKYYVNIKITEAD